MSTKKSKGSEKAPGSKRGDTAERAGGEFRAQGSAAFEAAIKDYEAALEKMRNGEFAAARELFRSIEAGHRDEPVLAERARTWLAACERRLAPPPGSDGTSNEKYLEAVGLLNAGRTHEALAILDALVAAEPREGSFWYARAVARAQRRDADGAADDLRRAIESVPHLRFQAAQDPDFESIRDEAAFIDVIEPTAAGA